MSVVCHKNRIVFEILLNKLRRVELMWSPKSFSLHVLNLILRLLGWKLLGRDIRVAHAQIKETMLNGRFKMEGLLQERPQFAQIFSRLMSLPFKFRGFSLPKILFHPKFTTISLSILFAFESTTNEFSTPS